GFLPAAERGPVAVEGDGAIFRDDAGDGPLSGHDFAVSAGTPRHRHEAKPRSRQTKERAIRVLGEQAVVEKCVVQIEKDAAQALGFAFRKLGKGLHGASTTVSRLFK